MRVFLAGATGVIGTRLVPLLLSRGHEVAAMARSAARLEPLRAQGATPVLCDVFDRAALQAAVGAFRPDVVMHQLTDLPDQLERVVDHLAANNRIRVLHIGGQREANSPGIYQAARRLVGELLDISHD